METIGFVLADSDLKGLRPDPGWDVAGLRDMVGGVVAVALVLTVGAIIIGCVSLVPGLVSNNQMERAFSWKRLLAAMLVPFVIGAAVSGWAWSCNVFGTEGLQANRSYTQESGVGKTDLADERGDGDDGLSGLVEQLGGDIATAIGDAFNDVIGKVTGADGQGNVFQKFWNMLTGDGQ